MSHSETALKSGTLENNVLDPSLFRPSRPHAAISRALGNPKALRCGKGGLALADSWSLHNRCLGHRCDDSALRPMGQWLLRTVLGTGLLESRPRSPRLLPHQDPTLQR